MNVSRAGPGWGWRLALAIAQEIAGAHGGKIAVRSQLARGTVFTVRLPLSQPNVATIATRKK